MSSVAGQRVLPLLGSMGMEAEARAGGVEARALISEYVRDPSGAVDVGFLGALIDTAAGILVLSEAAPRRAATSSLAVDLTGLAAQGTVVAAARVLRRRRRGMVLAVDVTAEPSGVLVALGSSEFALLDEHRTDELQTPPSPPQLEAPIGQRVTDALGLRVTATALDSVTVELDMAAHLRNTFGGLTGGVTTMIVAAAAARAGSHVLDGVATVISSSVSFLAPGRVGPLTVTASLIGQPGPGLGLMAVSVRDRGADDRLVAVARAIVARR